jgi:two-component system sensor histidine kinase UhpB
MAVIIATIGGVITLGFFDGGPLFVQGEWPQVSLAASLAALIFGTGIVAANGLETWPVRLFVGQSVSAVLLRWFFPLVALAMLLADTTTFHLFAHRSPALGSAFSTVFSLAIATILISYVGRVIGQRLDRSYAALRESEDKFSRVFAAVPAGLAVSTLAKGRYIEINDEFSRLYGFTQKEAIGHTAAELGIWPDVSDRQRLVADVINAGGTKRDVELNLRAKDGTLRIMRTAAHTIELQGEQVLVTTSVDVTEAQRKLTALRKSERILREAEQLGHTGSWEQDLVTGEIFNTEENLHLFFGDDRSRGARLEDYVEIVHPDDRDFVVKSRQNLLAQGNPRDVEYRVLWPDGSVHWLFGRATIVRDESGNAIRVHGTNLDITERKRAEEALREAADRLQQLSRRLLEVQEEERRQLSRELHDEFGQVIATITLLLHAAKGVAGEAARPRLDECAALLRRAGEQVRSLALELRPTMLETVGLEQTLRWLAEQHQQRTSMTTQVLGHLNDVSGDLAIACFRVVQEALTNVVRHAQAQRVWIELKQSDSLLELVVRDDGVGFDVASTVEQAAGRGHLGLLGMRERVQILGGSVEVHSQRGEGTRIRVSLPLMERTAEPAAPAA